MVADSTINSARHNDSIHTNEDVPNNQTNIRVLKSNAKMENGQPHPQYQQGISTTPRADLGGRNYQVSNNQAPHRQLIEVNNHAGGEGGGGQRLDSRGTSKFASQEDIIGVSRSFESPWNLGAKIRSSGKQRESRNGTPEVPLGLQTRQAPLANNNFGRLQHHT